MASADRVSIDVFHAVRTPRTFEDVVHQITEAIRSGVVQEADVLPGERALAQQMDVSRPTVRAAMAQLAAAGLLSIDPGRNGGARVTSMWIPEHLQLRPAAALPADEVFRLLEARRVLEPRIAQLAAIRATEQDFDRMRESIELQRAFRHDRHKAIQAEERFHRAMWRAGNNPVLKETMADVLARLEVVRDMILRNETHMDIALELHQHTLDALMRGDSLTIEAAMNEHLAYTEDLAENVLGRRVRIPVVLLPSPAPRDSPR